jgi:antitoxin component HigA of HigAB toxin-antitoxin module
MNLRPIQTERDYRAALKEVEALWDAPSGSTETDRLEVLAIHAALLADALGKSRSKFLQHADIDRRRTIHAAAVKAQR